MLQIFFCKYFNIIFLLTSFFFTQILVGHKRFFVSIFKIFVIKILWQKLYDKNCATKICWPNFFYQNYLLSHFFLERAIWNIRQQMWCSQDSVLRFSWCFYGNGATIQIPFFFVHFITRPSPLQNIPTSQYPIIGPVSRTPRCSSCGCKFPTDTGTGDESTAGKDGMTGSALASVSEES